MTTTRLHYGLDAAELNRTRPCRTEWCDGTCEWDITDLYGTVRVHQRHDGAYSLAQPERIPGGLDPSGPKVAFMPVESLTMDELRAHVSVLGYLGALVERDQREPAGR